MVCSHCQFFGNRRVTSGVDNTRQEVLPCKVHSYYWEEPYLFKYYADQIIRKCMPEEEHEGILSHCHDSAC